MSGPLAGLRVVEMAGIGPGPFAAMLLADMGADVVRVERVAQTALLPLERDPTVRGRTLVKVDLKADEGRGEIRRLAASAEVLLEGFRPGVMERLGLGPDELLADNPALVYGRMTGYGQDGPLAARAGHDLNYIAIAGVLGAIGRPGERPQVPLNLIGDYGGGGMLLALGVVCAVLEARSTGRGQVVDVAMTEGSSLLATLVHGLRHEGLWNEQPGTNLLDSGAPFYDTYETADGKFVAVGALEPQFYAELLDGLGLEAEEHPQFDFARWPAHRERFTDLFKSRTRDEWTAVFEDRDACVTPVLGLHEAASHHHNAARGAFVEGLPAPAPRFSATPSRMAGESLEATPGAVLDRWTAARAS